MSTTYYSIITNNGLIKNAQASVNNVSLDLVELAVGDSNGVDYNPDPTDTALQNELHRTNLTHVVIDENNPNQLIIEGVIDEEIGPFFVREIGIFDSDGDLFALGKFPETFKPNLPSGVGKKLYVRMILGFANAPNVTLIASDLNNDPNFSNHVNDEFSRVDDELDNRLKISDNLADLNNTESARNNLELKNGATSDLIGAVLPFSMDVPPDGWLECNGASLSRNTYADLFTRIGTIYGSNDSDSFNLPDLRGEFIRGWNHGIGNDPDSISRQDRGDGIAGDNVGTKQSWALQNMTGSVNVSSAWNQRARIDGQTGVLTNREIGTVYNAGAGGFAGGSPMGITFNASLVAQTSSETRPRNIYMMYCIKY